MNLEVLNYAIQNGILDLSCIEQLIKTNEKKKYLASHPYKLYLGSDGLWTTYLPDPSKKTKRRPIKRKEKKDLEDEIVSFYREKDVSPTVREVFVEANERRLSLGKIKPATYTRNEQTFNRHFKDFGIRRINAVTPEDICDFLEEEIAIQSLTAKGFANLKGVTKFIFKRAKKRNLFYYNIEEILSEIDTSESSFSKKVVDDEKEVFYDDEMDRIISYCKIHQDDVNCLGVALMFVSGMRVGEIVALKGEDILDGMIFVRRSETRYRQDSRTVFEVSDYPKTPAGVRRVIVPDNFKWVLDGLRRFGASREFIFVGESGNRLHTQAVRKRMYQICKKLSIPVRSPHKARKTYGSILLDANVDRKFIEKQMGHVDVSCTEAFYHRDRKKLEEKKRILNSIPQFETVDETVDLDNE